MLKAQFPGVQHLSRESFREFRTVNFIAEDWMPKMMKMHTNLMRPAAVQFAFDQTHLVRETHHTIFRFCCAPAFRRDRHSLSMHPMASNSFFNCSRAFPQLSRNEREINLLYATLRKLC